MSTSELSRHVRWVLETSPDMQSLADLLVLVDDFVTECSSSDQREALLTRLDEELQAIHGGVVDHSSAYQAEVFLSVLYHLESALSSASVVSWFDLVLRPSLREPKLSAVAVNYATELVVSALQKEQSGDFRRRIMEFYLLDAFNEGSGNDVLEWAQLDSQSREKRTRWKANLEQILLKFGLKHPEKLMSEIHSHFSTPSSRLQLLMLLNLYTSDPSFEPLAPILAKHELMSSLLYSLLFDSSSTACTIGLTLIAKLLPIFAVYSRDDLKAMLPGLLVISARLMCWTERPPSSSFSEDSPERVSADIATDAEIDLEVSRSLYIRSDLNWKRLEATFKAAASPPPSPRKYFTTLYYLFPCNLLRFLRDPVVHLTTLGYQSPYTIPWEEALDEGKIRSKSEGLLRTHICHPLIIWRDAEAELTGPDFWAGYDVARISSESVMLDVRNAALAVRGRHQVPSAASAVSEAPIQASPTNLAGEEEFVTAVRTIPTNPSDKSILSLQDMITTSLALKSNLDIEIQPPSTQWPETLFTMPKSPPRGHIPLPADSVPASDDASLPSHVAQAISALQQEVLLLRNDLNFELWLSRENVQHVGRLYQDRVLSRNAETERQGLYNKLRKYRAQVISLERELAEHKEHASSAKHKYADWNTELQKKLREFRQEKMSWISEAATLRTAEKEAQARFVAQGRLLADATKDVFELQTQKKENQHKVDRLKDYELQIEQHIKMQRLWEQDFQKFNERGDHMEIMKSQYRQMQLRMESYEQTCNELGDTARGYRRQIQALEARLALPTRTDGKQNFANEIASFAAEKRSLVKANEQLQKENSDLREEIEDQKAMVEYLRGQLERKGLV